MRFFKGFIYFFREGKGGRKRKRETSICGCLLFASDRAPACWFCGSVGGQLRKGQCCLRENCPPVLSLMPDTSVPPCLPLMPFKLLPWCWSSEGVSVSSCVGSLRGIALDSRSFFHRLNPCWFLQSEVMETYLPGTASQKL